MEKSESGAPIYRYQEIEKDGNTLISRESSINKITANIEFHFVLFTYKTTCHFTKKSKANALLFKCLRNNKR